MWASRGARGGGQNDSSPARFPASAQGQHSTAHRLPLSARLPGQSPHRLTSTLPPYCKGTAECHGPPDLQHWPPGPGEHACQPCPGPTPFPSSTHDAGLCRPASAPSSPSGMRGVAGRTRGRARRRTVTAGLLQKGPREGLPERDMAWRPSGLRQRDSGLRGQLSTNAPT